MLDKLYRGSPELLVASLLEHGHVTDAELERLQRLIERRMQENRN